MSMINDRTGIQECRESISSEPARKPHVRRAVAFGNLPRHVRLRRFPEEFAAIALIEAFGIENPVLLSRTAARR